MTQDKIQSYSTKTKHSALDMEITNPVHRKIIDAIIQKAEQICPDSLALIGIYGSVATGDVHEKSDLDLLILINDENGRKLSDAFLLDDSGIGYDIYCTDWNMLTEDAKCTHPHLAKLFDSRIVYVKDRSALERLDRLKEQAADLLTSGNRYENTEKLLCSAKEAYADCCLAESVSDARVAAGCCIHILLEALMLYHGKYFRRGIKRTFEELCLPGLPSVMKEAVTAVIRSGSAEDIQNSLTRLYRLVSGHLRFPRERSKPSADNLCGTYEEMFSNWKNKMYEAADRDDVYASFMNLLSLQMMIHALAAEIELEDMDIMKQFDPADLSGNAACFDHALEKYLTVYKKVDLQVRRFANVDAFITEYCGSSPADT